MDSSEATRFGEFIGILLILFIFICACIVVSLIECCKCESGPGYCRVGCGRMKSWKDPSMDGTWR